MELDRKVCRRARLSRDARFDGRYFVGVTTTGIYCRPVCPALPPKEENVRYFHSAAEAAGSGLRPCLRCRPEASPGTPAWLGTSATVSRALRLISERALDDGRVEELSERLGVGSRHLRRLFLKHLGASPVAVAQTRRLQFAKKLIDETDLPLTRVAFAAGFGSVRRFNATIRQFYDRTPGSLRQLARKGAARQQADRYVFRLAYRPPYNWASLIEFLARRATPGVEWVTADSYRRTIAEGKHRGTIEVRPIPDEALELRVAFPDPAALFGIIERVRRIFDLGADPAEVGRHLRSDPDLRALVEASPGQRVPGCWDGFELTVRAILGQQVSVRGATTLAGRLAARFGEAFDGGGDLTRLFPAPEVLADAALSSIGLPKARARAIAELARAVCRGDLSFHRTVGGDELAERLRAVPGVGDWTTQYVLMRAFGEPDAFPSSDLGLLKAVKRPGEKLTPAVLEKSAERWRPWRAYAAMYLWKQGANGRKS